MRACRRVEAVRRKPKPFDRTAVAQMALNDFIQVFGAHKSVPDLLGIHDNSRAVLALFQTAGFVDAKNSRQLSGLQFVFEQLVEFALAVRAARRAGSACLALIGANENMAVK